MSLPAAPDYFELSEYVAVLRFRWRIILLAACLGVAVAVGYLVVAPPVYTATVLIQVNALPNNANAVGGRTGGPVNMDNEGQMLRSAAVASIVRTRLHSTLPVTSIEQNIRLTVPPNTTFLQVTYAAPTAVAAQRWANAVGRAYLYERRISTEALVGSGIDALRTQAAGLRVSIERLKTLVYSTRHITKNNSGSAVEEADALQLSQAQVALQSVQTHIDAAMPLYDSLATKNSVIVGTIVSPATLPAKPSSPRKVLVLPSGLVAGLLLGLALAFLADRRNKRVRSARQAERLGGMPALLDLSAAGEARLTAIEPAASAAGQAFGELARQVSMELGPDGRVLAVASTSPGSRGSLVAANLAAALARTTDETVLVCADMRGTAVPQLLAIGRRPGLSEVLAGTKTAREVEFRPAGMPRLRVVTPGLDPVGAGSGIQFARLVQVVTDLLADARYVVIEVQSVGENAETFAMAEVASAAVVTVEIGSRPADVEACVRRLRRLRTSVLGAVVLPKALSAAGRRARRRSARSDAAAPERPAASVIERHPIQDEEPAPARRDLAGQEPAERSSSHRWRSEPELAGTPAPRAIAETWPIEPVPRPDRPVHRGPASPGAGT
jgi:polysaccharide biosynthesis transport protein